MNTEIRADANMTVLQKIDEGFYQCKLIMEDGNIFNIPMRADGYIHATKFCQSVGKRLDKWKDCPDTKHLIEYFHKTSGLAMNKIIEVCRGNTRKHDQGTWIHPDLGVQLAQWCSPIFSIQVSQWIRELMITGSVELGKEKSIEEIECQYKERLTQAEDVVVSLSNQNKYLQQKYDKLYLDHQAYLKRKRLYKLNKGKCVYIVNAGNEEEPKLKIGKSDDITNRISGFRTINPHCKLKFLLYTPLNTQLEDALKSIYEEQRPENREFIHGISLQDLKSHIEEIAKSFRMEYRVETEEELEKFNMHIIPEEQAEEIAQQLEEEAKAEAEKPEEEKTKRCGGTTHKTEEERVLPLTAFFKNKNNTDGHARLCKECYLTGVYGDQRKRRKVVVVPQYDTDTHKWCNLCESVKEHAEFYKSTSTKDGLCANCKTCKKNQKENRKKKQEEEQTTTTTTIEEKPTTLAA